MFNSLEYIYGEYQGKATMGAIANKDTDNELRAVVTFDKPQFGLTKDDLREGRKALVHNLKNQQVTN